MVAKICYNLLISSAPPRIDTYNIMLIHFTRLRLHNLAQAVVDSFFEDSRFRPSSSTVAAILDHYAAKGDRAGFNSVIQRMRGIDGDMRIGRRRFSDVVDPKLQLWLQQWKVIHRNGLLTAKMPRNRLVFNSLILGSLRVFGARRAVMYFKAALREGCYVTVDLFVRVAQACLTKRNKKAARALLAAIISRWHECKGSWRLESYSGSRGTILQLMDLCGIELLVSGNRRLPLGLRNVDFHAFNAWLRAVHLEVLDEHIKRSAKSISGLEIMLATSWSGAFTTEQIVLWMLELIDRHPLGKPRREPGVIVAAMQLATDGFTRSYKDMETQLFDIVYAGLSTDSQGKYNAMCKLLPNTDITLRLDIIRNLRQGRQEITEMSGLIKERDHALHGCVSPSKMNALEFAWRPSVAPVWA